MIAVHESDEENDQNGNLKVRESSSERKKRKKLKKKEKKRRKKEKKKRKKRAKRRDEDEEYEKEADFSNINDVYQREKRSMSNNSDNYSDNDI